MPIPDYQALMLPVLTSLADGQEHSLRDVVFRLAADLAAWRDPVKVAREAWKVKGFVSLDDRARWRQAVQSSSRGFSR